MKKIIALLLALSMLFSLAACGSPSAADAGPDASPAASGGPAEPAKPDAPAETKPEPGTGSVEPAKPDAPAETKPEPGTGSVEPAKPDAPAETKPEPDTGSVEPAKPDAPAETKPAPEPAPAPSKTLDVGASLADAEIGDSITVLDFENVPEVPYIPEGSDELEEEEEAEGADEWDEGAAMADGLTTLTPAATGILSSYWTGSSTDKGNGGSTPAAQSSSYTHTTPFGETRTSKAMTEKDFKPYGELITLVKSVDKPTADSPKNVKDTKYGKVDWSMAAQGYIEFTAKGAERTFFLQGPSDNKVMMDCAKNETIKIALADDTGKYQYIICSNDGKSIKVVYKNSFNVKTIDSDLALYLVSTPYGDYENAPNMVKSVSELWETKKNLLKNIREIADWVDDAIDYDLDHCLDNLNIYVNPDEIIEKGTGVCNEKAKILAAALRSQGIPAYYQYGRSAQGTAHAWVVAWVELSSETKNGTTYSTGTWIFIESLGGSLQSKSCAANNYTVGDYKN